MKFLSLIFGAILFQACSSIPVAQSNSKITLQEVEQVKLGEDSRTSLESKFGKPTQERTIGPDEYVIFYNRPYFKDETISTQRASFVISKKSGRVLTAQWTPNGESELKDVNEMKKYFHSSKFSSKKNFSANRHESALEYTLNDQHSGISLEVSEQDQKVESVGFSLPADRAVGSVTK